MSVMKSLTFLILVNSLFSLMLMFMLMELITIKQQMMVTVSLFPSLFWETLFFFVVFITIFFLNYSSLICYSYPVTTTLSFNMSFAFSMWTAMIILLFFLKKTPSSSLLPLSSPWYLASFLTIVEATSAGVRPITLCFRLLANMSAGHVMLSLVCKLPNISWMVGVPFSLLELMVAGVQSFVFVMLVAVYFSESKSH